MRDGTLATEHTDDRKAVASGSPQPRKEDSLLRKHPSGQVQRAFAAGRKGNHTIPVLRGLRVWVGVKAETDSGCDFRVTW